MDTPLDLRRPFTREAALRAGLTPRQLRGARVRRVLRGVYVAAGVRDSPLLRAQAALLVSPRGAFVSHTTAAQVHGLAVPARPEVDVTVSCRDDRRAREGIRCHVGDDAGVGTRDGVRLSGGLRLFAELAEVATLVDLVVVGDQMVRRGWVGCEALVDHCATLRGRAGRRAHDAASYVRERVDSPMESRLRMLLVLAGLPEPQVNPIVRDVDGQPVRRFDLHWPGTRLVVEYDGRHHVERETQWESDLDRREELDDGGYRLIVVTSAGIYRTPGATVRKVWRALAEAHHPGVPPRPHETWRAHFPGDD